MILTRTGKMAAFLDLHIGSPFFAHEKFWKIELVECEP